MSFNNIVLVYHQSCCGNVTGFVIVPPRAPPWSLAVMVPTQLCYKHNVKASRGYIICESAVFFYGGTIYISESLIRV